MQPQLIRRPQNTEMMDFGKLPPQAKELEEAVLGAILIESATMALVVRILRGSDYFYVDAHQRIYSAMIELWAENSPIDLLTVTEQLKTRGDLEASGGPFYIATLSNKVGSAANAEYHAHIVKQKWLRRRVISISTQSIMDAYEDTNDEFDLLEKGLTDFSNALTDCKTSGDESFASAIESFDEYLLSDDDKYGFDTGIPALNQKLLGYNKGHLVLLAGRPGEGKTTAMLQAVRASARKGIPVGIFSLEMNKRQLIQKLYAMEAGIDLQGLRLGKLSKEEWDRYKMAKKFMATWKIYIYDTPGVSIQEATAVAAGWYAKYQVEEFFFDYIQLMTVSSEMKRVNNREQEIGYISRSLKALSGNLNKSGGGVSVVALSAMSREIEGRQKSERRPMNSDLRDSGSLEQDANDIVFVFRPEEHGIDKFEDGTSTVGFTEFIITKARLGPKGAVRARFEGQYSRFQEYDDEYVGMTQDQINAAAPPASKASADDDLPF